MEFINIKFEQKKYFGIKPIEYEISNSKTLPDLKSAVANAYEKLPNKESFGENVVERVLNSETVENDDGGFIYANSYDNGYELYVCADGEGTDICVNKVFSFFKDFNQVISLTISSDDIVVSLEKTDDCEEEFEDTFRDVCDFAGVKYSKAQDALKELYAAKGTGKFSICGGFEYLNVSVDEFYRGCYTTENADAVGIIQQKIILPK